MLNSSKIVAFVATAQPEAARAFYEGILGLRLVEDAQFALVFEAGGVTLRIQKVQSVAVAPYTTLGWSVSDIAASIRALQAKGVVFERFDGLDQDELGIWASGPGKVAWFKDPDGNLLSLSSHE